MATFNIYGCCVCRDLFTFAENNPHEVIHFLQGSSPMVNFYFNDKPKNILSMENFENINMPNFKKKCIINDYNKTLVDYYEKPSDYMIIDFADWANTNLYKQTYEDGSIHYFSCSAWFNSAYKAGLKSFFSGSKIEAISRFKIFREIDANIIIDGLLDWLKNDLHYREDQIIMIENLRLDHYEIDKQLYTFPKGAREKVNNRLVEFYKLFKEKCPGCHSIKMPFGVYGDGRHPRLIHELHFCKEYYQYMYKCVNLIVDNSKTADERIAQLKEEYSVWLCKKLSKLITNSIVCKQYLNDDLSAPKDSYIVEKNTEYYRDIECQNPLGMLECSSEVINFDFPYSKIKAGYVKSSDCVKGLMGKDKVFNEDWKLANDSTSVVFNDHSITIKHSGNSLNEQMDVIQTVKNADELMGVPITFSVWARVLQKNNLKNAGGTIAFINGNSYNQGKLYAKKDFDNTAWQIIFLTLNFVNKQDFAGLTVCLRANAGTGDEPQHAIVEFAKPKLEIGVMPTDYSDFYHVI